MVKDLLEQVRKQLHAEYEKNNAYEALGVDKDRFVDDRINELTNVELLRILSDE
jgi:hypothetical protein